MSLNLKKLCKQSKKRNAPRERQFKHGAELKVVKQLIASGAVFQVA